MGYEAKKTEHSGPKRGNGAYWGYKWEAKKESNRSRRENWKREIRDESARAEPEESTMRIFGVRHRSQAYRWRPRGFVDCLWTSYAKSVRFSVNASVPFSTGSDPA